jgi:hypothetical protein
MSTESSCAISYFRMAAVLVFVILNLAVFSIRLVSVLHYGDLFPTSGGESLVIYPVWKAIHYYPVYEWPLSYPFSLALYNYLFYNAYAVFLRLIGATGASMMIWGRLFTPVFAMIGAVAQWKLVQYHLKLRGMYSVLSLCLALGLWISASIVRAYALSIRPDLAAVAMVMVALWMLVRQSRFNLAYAGVFFYLAWSFKQSVILAFIAVCLFLLFHKRWRDFLFLATVFAILVGITLLIGSPEYRYGILAAPALVKEFSIKWALQIAPKAVAANLYWILAPVALLLATGARRIDNTVSMLSAALVVALAGGLAGMTKIGSWDNYLLEAFVAGSTLFQIAVFAAPGRLVSALVLFGCVQPAVQATMAQSGTSRHLLGTVGIATKSEYADAVAMRDRLASLRKPIFTTNEIFSLPWFSTDNRAPALVIDTIFHDATRTRCQNGCVEGMLQRGEIPTAMLLNTGDSYQRSLNSNYKKIGGLRESDRLWSIYVLTTQKSEHSFVDKK